MSRITFDREAFISIRRAGGTNNSNTARIIVAALWGVPVENVPLEGMVFPPKPDGRPVVIHLSDEYVGHADGSVCHTLTGNETEG